jgi:hypothetical protein
MLARIDIINQRTNKEIMSLPPGAAEDFALDYAGQRDSDDIMFIGLDSTGHVEDAWTLSEVLAGSLSRQSRRERQAAAHKKRMKQWENEQKLRKERRNINATR